MIKYRSGVLKAIYSSRFFVTAGRRSPHSNHRIAQHERLLRAQQDASSTSSSSSSISCGTQNHQRTIGTSRLLHFNRGSFHSSSITLQKTESGPPSPAVGLFSLPNLHKPSDFLTLASDAVSTCNDLRQQIQNSLETKHLSPQETLFLLDDISNTVCSVIDASELCRSVHASPQWREAASNAFHLLSEYIAELNADECLYQSLIPITTDADVMNHQLDEEERRMAIMLQKEFERDGIHLSKVERDEVRKLSGFVTQLETMFSNNLLQSKTFTVEGDLVNDVTQVIPRHVLINYNRSTSNSQSDDRGVYTSAFQDDTFHTNEPLNLSTDPHITNTLLRHSQSPALRQKVYVEANTTCPQNLEVLDALIQQRHELATKMGYPSYSHYFTSDKMAGHPQNVMQFLRNVDNACNERYKHEMELLLNAKKHVEGGSSSSSNSIEAWDLNFYNGLIKSHMFYNNENDGRDDDGSNANVSLAGYFTVEQSLYGMKILVRRLFGIIMEEVETHPCEQWDCDDTMQKKESLIRKFNFYKEEDASPLGTIYLDLHPREGKYAHAAHFTVRCGCEIRSNDSKSSSNSSVDSQYQVPIVALVCNLSPPLKNHGKEATILSHSEVETLFHVSYFAFECLYDNGLLTNIIQP